MGRESSPFRLSFVTTALFFTVTISDSSSPVQATKMRSASGIGEANVALNIPSKGLTSNQVEEVSLGGSQILLVVDESNKAVFKPQGGKTGGKQNEGLNDVAYAVENGHCNPGKTLTYDEVFPGLSSSDTKTFWVKTTESLGPGSQYSFTAAAGSAPVTNYVFTNPAEDKLQGKQVSFCVRFHSPVSVTSITTVATTSGSVATQESTQKPVPTQQNPQQTGAEDSATPSAKAEVQQPSLEALVKKDLTDPTRGAHKLEEDKEEPLALLEKDDNKEIAHKMPGVYLSKQSADHEGETPAGYDLTVIIHSSASRVPVHTRSIFVLLASSLLGILRGASSS